MPPKKGTSTPNKPPENPTWTLDEGEEMRRDINELQAKMDSMESKLDTKMDSILSWILRWIQWNPSWILRWIQWKLRSWKY
jgi:hypothetical protein